MSDDIKSIMRVSNAQVGDNSLYNRNSLHAYKLESLLKRAITKNSKEILEYVKHRWNIPETIKIRMEGVRDEKSNKLLHEEFETIELIKLKIVDFDVKTCMKMYDIYENKGIKALISAIQYTSPIQKL